MEEKSPVYLVMVTTNNNNKYYRMIPHGDTFEAEYGRVGASCQHASYSMSQWNKKYNEKIKKGYVDQTHLVQDLIQKEKPKGKDGYKEIENKENIVNKNINTYEQEDGVDIYVTYEVLENIGTNEKIVF